MARFVEEPPRKRKAHPLTSLEWHPHCIVPFSNGNAMGFRMRDAQRGLP